MGLRETLQALMDERGENPHSLAQKTGVPQPTIYRILTGESADPRRNTVERLAKFFALTVDDMYTGRKPADSVYPRAADTEVLLSSDTNIPPGVAESVDQNTEPGPAIRGDVPLISWVQAGQWCEVVDNFSNSHAEQYVPTTVPIRRHTYALRVKGDSMTNPNGWPSFPEGMVIIVEPEMDALPEDFVIVRNGDNEATFKQLIKDGGDWLLKPLNPRYPIKQLPRDAHICGVVRGYGGIIR